MHLNTRPAIRPSSATPFTFQRTQLCLTISAMLVPAWSFAAPVVGPNGGVVSGAATISQNGSVTNINQSSNKAIINWQSFSTTPNETVNFNQLNASSVTLNRVIGNEKSVLQGALNAPSKVYLVNKNGVLISRTATVNTSGFVASTLNISDDDFNKARYVFKADGTASSVTNLGTITVTDGGYVVLMGNLVSNQGTITATRGTVSLNSGNKITLNFEGNSLVSVTIDEGTLNALVENRQAIYADGGRVIMTAKAADALLGAQVNNTGIVQAHTINDLKGSIEIYAHGGTTNVSGRLDASAATSGNGGFIETSGDKVRIADGTIITTKAAHGKSGTWLIDPTDFTISAGSAGRTTSGMGAATLSTALNNGSVTIATMDTGSQAGDINVNSAVSWSANSTLTLDADRDININAPIKATGNSAGLVVTYGRDYNIRTKASYSGVADAPGPVYDKNGKPVYGADGKQIIGPVAKQDTSGGVYGSITLSGADATLNINNQEYTLIHSMAELASKINGNVNPNGLYALAQNFDANGTTYTGAVVTTLTGTLAGLGHTVSNLTINAPTTDNVGLIGEAKANSVLRDIGLLNAKITGHDNVGALLGFSNIADANNIKISNAYSSGTVSGNGGVGGLIGVLGSTGGSLVQSFSDAAVAGTANNVGGLVGNARAVTISRSHATGVVTFTSKDTSGDVISSAGGLVGWANLSSIDYSYATGDVKSDQQSKQLGGLVGQMSMHGDSVPTAASHLENSFATGNVTGGDNLGGLVGALQIGAGSSGDSSILNVYAMGDVTGLSSGGNLGGLIGLASGRSASAKLNIENTFASGNVNLLSNSGNGVGGLIGSFQNGSISDSHATGKVTGSRDGGQVGGLVGGNSGGGSVINSYATGDAHGHSQVGGLVGNNDGFIRDSYATGAASVNAGGGLVGGLVGQNGQSGSPGDAIIENSYWNSSTNATGIGENNRPATNVDAHGLNSNQLADVNHYLDGTIDQVLADRAAQAAADKDAEEKAEAIQQVQIEDASQPAGSAIQSLQQDGAPKLPELSTTDAAPSIDSQIVFADTENFSADVKSIVVDGVRFNLEEKNEDENEKKNK